jgi:hypothetical protein
LDATTAKWFDDTSVSVHRAPELAGFMADEQIARLTGAPRNSVVRVSLENGGVAFQIDNDIFAEPMYRYLFQNLGGSYSFHLKNVVMVLAERHTDEGIGPRCVIREIYEAAKWADEGILITHIEVSAVGNYAHFVLTEQPLRGYYVWATMGFDGDIPGQVRIKLRPEHQKCSKISELIATEDGRNAWRIYGESVDLAFDLAMGSASWRQLAKYMNDKGIEL